MENPLPLLKRTFAEYGIHGWPSTALAWAVEIAAMLAIAFLAYLFCRFVIGRLVSFLVRRTRTQWDDALAERGFFRRLAHVGPALAVYAGSAVLSKSDGVLERMSVVYMMGIGVFAAMAFLDAAVDIYQGYAVAKQRPIKGFVEVAKLVLILFVGVLALAVLLNRSPWILLSGLGAMTAVLLLVFKDTLLGLVAGVQLTVNDMVAIGDWIEMPKHGADGDVVDITLHTVKVQNFDKSITTVPSYALVSDSFKNWRGMTAGGTRRIKRSVVVDLSTIGFCTPELVAKYPRLKDTEQMPSGLPPTNIGAFRAYIERLLRGDARIHREASLVVRELEPTQTGIPVEIYAFAADPAWGSFESLQAEIVDHIVAVAPEFGLRIYQSVK